MKTPKNIQAITDWVKTNRPDLVSYLPAVEGNDALLLLISVGFEAGRKFQHDNPTFELNNPSLYLS